MTDVALIHPFARRRSTLSATSSTSEHLGLAYLAAALEHSGLGVTVIDLENTPEVEPLAGSLAASAGVSLVGISPTSRSAQSALEITDAIKRLSSQIIIAWGGHLVTGLGERLFQIAPSVDIAVVGAGEELLPAIAHQIRHDHSIPAHPRILLSPHSDLRSCGSVGPSPSWLSLRPKRYLPNTSYHSHGARVLTSMGCPYDCNFCTTPLFSGRRQTRRSVSDVVDEIQVLRDMHGVGHIWINDDLFIDGSRLSQRWARSFALELMARKIAVSFRAMLRADSLARDIALLDDLCRAGLTHVFVGVESGDNQVLGELGKRTSRDENSQMLDALRARGVTVQLGFIMFTSASTAHTLSNSIDFLIEHSELYRFTPASRTCTYFPGTELWRASSEHGFDEARSTEFLRYPRFQSDAIRRLSIAFEGVEEDYASFDAFVYRAGSDGILETTARVALSEAIGRAVRECVALADARAPADKIRERMRSELPTLISILDKTVHVRPAALAPS